MKSPKPLPSASFYPLSAPPPPMTSSSRTAFSCREQVHQNTDRKVIHIAEVLAGQS